jgi:hypothetical protein
VRGDSESVAIANPRCKNLIGRDYTRIMQLFQVSISLFISLDVVAYFGKTASNPLR